MIDPTLFRTTPGGNFSLDDHDPDATPGFDGDKGDGEALLPALNSSLATLQERLWAESERSVLVVLQAMDTGGKDGTIRHVFKGVNPHGVKVWSFGKPSEADAARDYLWRVHLRTPPKGTITIFNRSHYEDVLVVRVKSLVPTDRWSKRYEHIRNFERLLVDEGTTIVKVFLHISKDEQRERLEARLSDPQKRWKFRAGDLDDRALWEEFQKAYETAIEETSTDYAPWFVIPGNHKWYRDLAVSSILIDTIQKLDPQFPVAEPGLEGIVIT